MRRLQKKLRVEEERSVKKLIEVSQEEVVAKERIEFLKEELAKQNGQLGKKEEELAKKEEALAKKDEELVKKTSDLEKMEQELQRRIGKEGLIQTELSQLQSANISLQMQIINTRSRQRRHDRDAETVLQGSDSVRN